MNKIKIGGSIIIFFFMITVPALAGNFDGSKPMLCALINIVECGSGGNCQQLTAQDAGIPRFLKVNFKEMVTYSRACRFKLKWAKEWKSVL